MRAQKTLFYTLLLSVGCLGQTYPDVIWVPVTFYDFHSDRSNPEFEQRHQGMLRTGMVGSTLGADGKPTLGPSPYLNYYVKYWFRPWEQKARGDKTIPVYDPRAGFKEGYYGGENWKLEFQQPVVYKGTTTVDHDTSFKNLVIKDSLAFRHVGNGLYEYKNDYFFPLDNRGFGNEWNHEIDNDYKTTDVNHNYSFTMELHWSFTKRSGLRFEFRGDDDVWVFVNKQLKMDLGGIHEAVTSSFSVDQISGLIDGAQYDLDVFYAERHSAESHIWISTNLIYSPSSLRLYGEPGAPDVGTNAPLGAFVTVKAGEAFGLYGHVFDSLGVWRSEFDSQITWRLESAGPGVALSSASGSATSVTATGAGATFVVVATYVDKTRPGNPVSQQRISVTVAAGEPYRIDIWDDSLASPSSSVDRLYFPPNQETNRVYAIIVDKYGNYVRPAQNPQWSALDYRIVQVTDMRGNGATIVRNPSTIGDETQVTVRESGLLPDSVLIGSEGTTLIWVSPNPFTPGVSDLKSLLSLDLQQKYREVIDKTPIGLLITVETARPLKPLVGNEYGRAEVYDVVGNLVVGPLPLIRGASSRAHGIGWDGRNRANRYVGSGTYLVKISGTYVDGSPFSARAKIGVKR